MTSYYKLIDWWLSLALYTLVMTMAFHTYLAHVVAKAKGQTLFTGVLVGLRFTVTMIALNLIFLPLIVIPPVYLFASWALNGYLLSREFFELVAYRRLDIVNVNRIYKKFRFTLLGYGLVIAFISIIPVINFIVPLFGTAVMLHAFQRIQSTELV